MKVEFKNFSLFYFVLLEGSVVLEWPKNENKTKIVSEFKINKSNCF